MKLKLFIIFMLIMSFASISADATQLPKNMKDYFQLQRKIPSIRFDGIIVYSNDVMYIPILPAYEKEVSELKIVKTYPLNQKMDNLPDMVLFNNNYGLLKVYRIDDSTLTVKNIPDLPVEIKTGTLPQDIMVPKGLVFPESLAGILGDIQVPLIGSAKSNNFVRGRKTAPLPSGKRVADTKKYNIPVKLKNKLFFVNNFQTEYLQVFSSTVTEPLYSLKTSGVMKDVKPALNGKYILAATKNQKNIDVIDVANEYVAKHIDLTSVPSEIAVDDIGRKAYVASIADECLFVIDLESMTMKEKIQLVGAPQRLSISKDGTKIAYLDMKTSNIYILDLLNDYENKLISNYPNTTKLILDQNFIYVIARTVPKLRIINFDLLQDNKVSKSKLDKLRDKIRRDENAKSNVDSITSDIFTSYDYIEEETKDDELLQNVTTYATSIKDIDVGTKPVDLYQQDGNIYVLCAGNNSMYKYNNLTGEITNDKLPVDGFSKTIAPIPNSNLAVITNMSDLKYIVYDLDRDKAVQTLPISEYVNSIIILERNNEK